MTTYLAGDGFTGNALAGNSPVVDSSDEVYLTVGIDDFDDFYRSNYPRLTGTLRLVTGDPGVAEELAQEAFVRAYSRWAKVATHESPAGWLFTTALNLSRKRWSRLTRGVKYQPEAAAGESPEDSIGRSELIAALGRLPIKQRSAVVLRHVLGYSTDEAAEMLEMSPANLRTTLHRALAALRLDPSFLEVEGPR